MSIWATFWESYPGDVHDAPKSHVYPADETPAEVYLSKVPAWCVPGHEHEEDNDTHTGDRLRMTNETDAQGLDVILTPTGARDLANALHNWANSPHLTPKEQA